MGWADDKPVTRNGHQALPLRIGNVVHDEKPPVAVRSTEYQRIADMCLPP